MKSVFEGNRNTKKRKKNLSQIGDDDYAKQILPTSIHSLGNACSMRYRAAFNSVSTFVAQAHIGATVSHNLPACLWSRPTVNRIDNHSHLRLNPEQITGKLKFMYVCICKSVTDKQIRRAAAGGVDNLYELREALGVAAGCGSCASMAQSILDDCHGKHSQPSVYVASPA